MWGAAVCRSVRGRLGMWGESLQQPVSQGCAGPASRSDTLWPQQEQQPAGDGIPRLSPPESGHGAAAASQALGLSLSCWFTNVLSSFLSWGLCIAFPACGRMPFTS